MNPSVLQFLKWSANIEHINRNMCYFCDQRRVQQCECSRALVVLTSGFTHYEQRALASTRFVELASVVRICEYTVESRQFKVLGTREIISSSNLSKTCLKRPLSKMPNFGFQDQLSLKAGPKGAFCNSFDLHKATICHMFCLLLSGRLKHVLLYRKVDIKISTLKNDCYQGFSIKHKFWAHKTNVALKEFLKDIFLLRTKTCVIIDNY